MSVKTKSLLDKFWGERDTLAVLLTVGYFVASAQNYDPNREKRRRDTVEAYQAYHLEGGGILECQHCQEQRKYQNL